MNFIQELLVNADRQLYDGAGEMSLISNNGRLIASTQAPDKLGSPATELLDANELDNLKRLVPGQIIYDTHHEANAADSHIELFLSFAVGNTAARWTLMLVLPLDTVMAELQLLHNDLSAQRQADTSRQCHELCEHTRLRKRLQPFGKIVDGAGTRCAAHACSPWAGAARQPGARFSMKAATPSCATPCTMLQAMVWPASW